MLMKAPDFDKPQATDNAMGDLMKTGLDYD